MMGIGSEQVFADEAGAMEIGDGVAAALELFLGQVGDGFEGHHPAVPRIMNMIGDVLQAYSQFRPVIGAEVAGLEFANQLLKGIQRVTKLELNVFNVQGAIGAEGEFAEDAIGEEIGSSVAMAFEFFLCLCHDLGIGKVAAVPGAADTDLYFIERKRLKQMTHASFKRLARCNVKLQPTVLRKAYDLGLVQNLGLTFSDRVHQPPGPLNLRAFQEGRNATYTQDEDIELSWNLSETGPRDFWGRWRNPATLQTSTVLEFFTLEGTLKQTVTTAPGATSYTYKFNYDAGEPSRPYITAKFGATPPSIKVRATALENGLKSRFNEELTIRKI
jgi:hypothetical protein